MLRQECFEISRFHSSAQEFTVRVVCRINSTSQGTMQGREYQDINSRLDDAGVLQGGFVTHFPLNVPEPCDCLCCIKRCRRNINRTCSYHGATRKDRAHDELGRRVIGAVLLIDPSATMLPEFSFHIRVRTEKGTYVCRRYTLDLLVVLGTGQLIAFEIDGSSHDTVSQRRRDEIKGKWLEKHHIKICRLDIRATRRKLQKKELFKLYDRELSRVRRQML